MAAVDNGSLFDVIVVGGGIMGSCAAYAAASRGGAHARAAPGAVRPAPPPGLLARRVPRHPRHVPAGALPAHGPPRRAPLGRRPARRDRVLTPTPQLDMGPRGDPDLRAAIDNGGAAEVASGSASWPWSGVFRLPEGWTAATSELGGVIKATKAVAMFQSLAVKHGAALRDRVEVVDVAKQGKGGLIVVKTSSGEEFHGAKCIITVGAWASKLVKSVAGVDLPVQPLHTLICYWKVRPGREHELTPEVGFPTFCCYGDTCIYSTPSMEFPGLIKVCMHGGAPCDPDRRDWCATGDALVDPVARWINELMPGHVDTAGGPVIRQSCMYSMTPDVDFIIDFVGGELGKDVVIGAGFSGHGFKMGPAVGRVLAEMAMDGEAITAAEAGVEVRHFRVGRFMDNPEGNLAENKVKS